MAPCMELTSLVFHFLCACSRPWLHSNQAFSHILLLSNFLTCDFLLLPIFPVFYLDLIIPPPSEIMHDYMPLLLFHLFVIIPIRIPFLIFTVSLNRPCFSLRRPWPLGYLWLFLCVCVSTLLLGRRTISFFSSTQHTFH